MLTEKIKKSLKEIVGSKGFIDAPEDLSAYSYDAFVKEAMPELVLLPECTADVAAIMAIAHQEGIPVTARGAGTNISGASIPAHKGIVLSLTRMDQILEVSTPNRYCIVQPGVVNGDLQACLAQEGFFYPPDPGSYMASTIGGNVAQNAGGPRCLKYGVTVDYVLSMEVVLASGEVIRFGSRNVKDVTGYRLSSLFCGSEGTLGIVTEITLRVVPLPEATRTILAVYGDLDDTADTVADIIGSGILPAALELMDKTVVNAVEDSAHIGLPRHAEGLLLIEVDGAEAAVEKEMRTIVEKAKNHGAQEVIEARTAAERDDVWTARRSAYGVFARLAPDCIVEDATVPVSHVPDMIRHIRQIADRYQLRIGILAHAGDGNMHPLISTDTDNKEEWQRVEAASREIFELAMSYHGTLSGEHGIGLAKTEYLPMAIDDATQAFMTRIKQCVDPKGILNPGKFV
ncbi:FAD-linked oxidase C-terminal domain-containing protein [uncultured Desulfobacter sp.]|uniref:FAD-binding oxidoreductase n=1 Tax=uncultured Desulfobacter sp. TaxID=240139 RepID=UPI0029F59498|nr:FAD-linked oxidase C-terminal domain-containing protein [uncultured Desulfobacter sp.]